MGFDSIVMSHNPIMEELDRSYLEIFIVHIKLTQLLRCDIQLLLQVSSTAPRVIQIKLSILELFRKALVLIAERILNIIGIK